ADRRARQLRLALEVVRDRLSWLLGRGLLGGRRVDRNPQTRVAVARMPGFAPRGAIDLQMPRELWDAHAAQADEDRQPHLRDAWKRLGRRRRHAQRRMRRMERPRRDRDVGEAIELALVAEALALPRLEHDLER